MEARNAVDMLKVVISYGCLKHPAVLPFNPLRTLTHKGANILPPIKARTECLVGDDFQAFYQGIQQFNEVTRDGYLFTLYTGMRYMEAALRWEHVDLSKKAIRIPDTKNRQPLHVPLSRQSLVILERRKAQAVDGSPFVFPAQRLDRNKTGHVRLLDEVLRFRTGLKITVHELRRTFITTGRKLKLFENVDRLSNHLDSSVSGRHYDQTDVDDLRQPLQVIYNEIERLMTEGTTAKVVKLNG